MDLRLTLASGPWTAEISPQIGGAILALAHDGAPVLRPTPDAVVEARDVRHSACYPLIPYANRIANGRFSFAGEEHQLAPNFPGPHTLHGVGWRRAWRTLRTDGSSCAIALEHRPVGDEAADWPFAFDARQVFELGEHGLTVRMAITNADDRPAPAGLGLHAFFPRRPGERIAFRAAAGWSNGADMLPDARHVGGKWDFAGGQAVDPLGMDNDFDGWDGARPAGHPAAGRRRLPAAAALYAAGPRLLRRRAGHPRRRRHPPPGRAGRHGHPGPRPDPGWRSPLRPGSRLMAGPYDSVQYRSLEGRSVLVTGGASGIGASIVEAFVAQGARVAFLDIEPVGGAALAARLNARFIQCDLTDIDALRAAVSRIDADQRGIDVLVNNAGKDDRQPLAEITPEDWRRHLAFNLDHQFFASQAAAPLMAARGGGSIVMMGSVSWMRGRPGMAGYTTAKAAINGLTRTLARELGPEGVRVNCIVPGAILTERQRALWLTPELDAEFIALQSLKFRLTAEHVARMALFLGSDESGGCTGANFLVDAGLTQN
jgi:NAD(P)-dependent dehydrogenase (short-subunit alcohol dehydrogenase family)